ncbi:hypothetical protein DFJ58DRAFT_446924 [Suillus subalutaceus]|uniref:uncharacterized protein n=1 Tax=Suillus subalutaceus TaxID=48586 RepID=UPI001B86B8B3|nr:uncharacterized protein DFJ58DRAFT_446924 [Suillus subalutaceus]KAG1849915.1 hypothetical protein DFJ58DRAFT_446924 [Suillus subalutaceus]
MGQPVHRTPPGDRNFYASHRSVHSIMGYTHLILCPLCWNILYPSWCSGRLGVLVTLMQTYQITYKGAKWMLPMVLGEYFYVIGFGFRFVLHYNPDSLGIYIAEYLMIVLSPCFFIATNYVLLGRLAREIDCVHRVLLPAAGASITTSTVYSSALTGLHIFLAGLVLQLVSVSLFSVIYARFLYKVHAEEQTIWMRDSKQYWNSDWRTLAAAAAVSCIGILIRSCYRVAEVAQGL